MKKFFISILIFLTFFAAGSGFWVYSQYQSFISEPIAQNDTQATVLIPAGSRVSQIAKILADNNVLQHPDYFQWYVRLHKLGASLKAGEYVVSANLTVAELIELLQTGKSVQYPFTLVAGQTVAQFLSQLNSLPHLTFTQDWTSEAGRVALHKLLKQPLSNDERYPYANVEGRLLPETFFYPKGEKDINLILRAAKALDEQLENLWQQRVKDLPLKSKEEALILASIVEKETGFAPERPKIAGVFVNRLRKKMRLQTDPTVIYGIGQKYDGNIRKRDLRKSTPYNTYTISALPPTAIAFASLEAIAAVMKPEKTRALYFVAKGGGQHHFSKSLQEHNAAVRKYLLNK